jgi:hypothetical protein
VHHAPNISDTTTAIDEIIVNFATLTGELTALDEVPEQFFVEQGNFLLYALIELLREKARELR